MSQRLAVRAGRIRLDSRGPRGRMPVRGNAPRIPGFCPFPARLTVLGLVRERILPVALWFWMPQSTDAHVEGITAARDGFEAGRATAVFLDGAFR